MPSSHWGIGFALGLTLGICLTLFLIVGFSGGAQVVQAERNSGHQAEHSKEHTTQQPNLLPGLEPYGVVVTPADTFAQWIMAALGLVATGLSGWAVILLKRTLTQTAVATMAAENAVEVTREMGAAQVRAYVGLESTNLSVSDTRIFGKVTFKNFGQSPADKVKVRLMWCCQSGEFVQDWLAEAQPSKAVGSIPPTGQVLRTFATSESLDTGKALSAAQIANLLAGKSTFWVFGDITYSDAFGRTHKASFRLWMAQVDGKYTLAFCDEGNDSV